MALPENPALLFGTAAAICVPLLLTWVWNRHLRYWYYGTMPGHSFHSDAQRNFRQRLADINLECRAAQEVLRKAEKERRDTKDAMNAHHTTIQARLRAETIARERALAMAVKAEEDFKSSTAPSPGPSQSPRVDPNSGDMANPNSEDKVNPNSGDEVNLNSGDKVNPNPGEKDNPNSGDKFDRAQQEGIAFLAANKVKEGVVETASGLQYKVLKSGPDGGKTPLKMTKCLCHYKGTTITGEVLGWSMSEGHNFSPIQVIKGWGEAMQMMKEGDRWKLFIPSELGGGNWNIKLSPGAVVVFELELVEVKGPAVEATTAES